jgi:sugar diacid utilization regulator
MANATAVKRAPSRADAAARQVRPGPAPERDAFENVVRAFGEVAEALTADRRDLDQFLHLVAAKICELIEVRRCSVYLRDEKSGLFRGKVGHADRDIDAKIKRLVAGVPADRFTQEILRTRRPVLLRSALKDPRPIRSTMRAWSVRAMLGVPLVLREDVVGIIFLDNEDEPHSFTSLQQSLAAAFGNLAADAIVQAQLTASLRSSRGMLAKHNTVLRRAALVEERLTKLVLEEANLRRIAAAVAELTGRPCSLHDAEFSYLGTGLPPEVEGGPAAPRLLEPRHRAVKQISAAIGALRGKRSGIIGPFPAVGLHQRFLLAPIVARSESWGHVVLVEHGSRFSALDMLVAQRAAMIVALEISAETRAASARWDASGSLVSELVRGNRDHDALRRQAECVGTDLDAPQVLMLVTAREPRSTALPSARVLAAAFADAGGGERVLATGVAEGAILISRLADGVPIRVAIAQVRDHLRAACDELAPDGSLIAGVSVVCRSPGDYADAYTEVGALMGVIDDLAGKNGNVAMAIDDLGAGRMLLVGVNDPSGRRYVEDVLGPLLDFDNPKLVDLLITLQTFLDCSRNIRRCAEALDVHDNTIRYRIARIEELLGLAVGTDGEAQLNAQMALLLLRLRGEAPQLPAIATAPSA